MIAYRYSDPQRSLFFGNASWTRLRTSRARNTLSPMMVSSMAANSRFEPSWTE